MNDTIGLYIHIPFCNSKCPYCDFYSTKANENDFDKYIEELCKKIVFWSKKTNKKVSSIYFGGGTPSVLGANRLCKLLNCIINRFNVLEEAEITVEINPDTGKIIDFASLKSSGFNRISVGLQSAVEKELKVLGRIHTAQDAAITVNRAKSAEIDNISLDLMIAIPYQNLETLEQSIRFCNECGVKHLSSYILKLEKNTPYYKVRNQLKLADEDKQADMYLRTVELLNELGYKQYEISNFAKNGYESRHNMNYWKCGEYIGIGPSAHSFYNDKRFFYNRNMEDFIDNKIFFDCYGGNEEEYIMLALRLNSGLSFDEYKERFGKNISQDFIEKAEKLVKSGYATLDSKRFCLTSKGFLVSNSIISMLI